MQKKIAASVAAVALPVEMMAAIKTETMMAAIKTETRMAAMKNLLVSAWILTMDSWTSMVMGVKDIPKITIVIHGLTGILDSIAYQCAASAEEDPPPEK